MEVMYVNWIVDPVDEWFKPAEGGRLSGRHADARPEGYAWQARYPIRQGGARIGRLKAESQTAVRLVNETWQEGSQFSLRARFAANGALNEADLEPMLYIGNQSIVQAFKDLTTAAAHESASPQQRRSGQFFQPRVARV